jgi:hypothetical protein
MVLRGSGSGFSRAVEIGYAPSFFFETGKWGRGFFISTQVQIGSAMVPLIRACARSTEAKAMPACVARSVNLMSENEGVDAGAACLWDVGVGWHGRAVESG